MQGERVRQGAAEGIRYGIGAYHWDIILAWIGVSISSPGMAVNCISPDKWSPFQKKINTLKTIPIIQTYKEVRYIPRKPKGGKKPKGGGGGG